MEQPCSEMIKHWKSCVMVEINVGHVMNINIMEEALIV
jgi:hypothetical protein